MRLNWCYRDEHLVSLRAVSRWVDTIREREMQMIGMEYFVIDLVGETDCSSERCFLSAAVCPLLCVCLFFLLNFCM